MLTVDLHPIFRNTRDVDLAVRGAVFRAAREGIGVVEAITGKGRGVLRQRVLGLLRQPALRKLYRSVEVDPSNDGRIVVRF